MTDIKLEFSSVAGRQVINSLIEEQNQEPDLNEEIILGETHNLIIEARIEMIGAKILPNEQISQPFSHRKNLIFRWQIVPVVRQITSGEVWLYMHLIPLGSGSDIRRPVLIQGITIQAIDLFGMNTRTAKLLMVTGIGIGFIVWFDLVGKIITVLFKRK